MVDKNRGQLVSKAPFPPQNKLFWFLPGAPVARTHLHLFGGRGEINKKNSRHNRINHFTSINVDIEHPDDGNVLVAGRILGNQQAKISWRSLVTEQNNLGN